MSETAKTVALALVAAAFLLVAFLVRPASTVRPAYDDSGERFFAPFEPLDAASLEIVGYDDETARVRAFKVANAGGAWVIPSHEGYPADAEQQLARAAASVVDLVKGPTVSDAPSDHALHGVLDPLEESVDVDGAGTRVTFRDAAGSILADFIIGDAVPGTPALRYVRVPGQDRVYTAAVTTTALSTRFEDWIEDDLLDLTGADLRRIVVNDYEIDEVRGTVAQGELVTLRSPDGTTWTMDGLREGEQIDQETLDDLQQALDDLRIVDVHRKPAGLTAELKGDDALELDMEAQQSLANRGFYVLGNALVSNQGETIVKLQNGVSYVLRFGEIALADTGDVLGDEAADGEADPEPASRYLFVMAEFDESIIPPLELQTPPALPESAEGEGEPGSEVAPDLELIRAQREQIIAENERKRQARDARIQAGRELVASLNARFADWYYVIADDVYRKIRLRRDALVEPVPAEEALDAGTAEDVAAPDVIGPETP